MPDDAQPAGSQDDEVQLPAETRHWHCPACDARLTTDHAEHPLHECPANGGLRVHLVEVTSPSDSATADHRVQLGERDGAPVITSVATHHDDGHVDRSVLL